MVSTKKTVLSAKEKAELKPFVYMLAIGVPLVAIMWALRKENNNV